MNAWRRFLHVVILPLLVIEFGAGVFLGMRAGVDALARTTAAPPPMALIRVRVLDAETADPIWAAVVDSATLGVHHLTDGQGDSVLAIRKQSFTPPLVDIRVSKAGYFADRPDQIYQVTHVRIADGEPAMVVLTLRASARHL